MGGIGRLSIVLAVTLATALLAACSGDGNVGEAPRPVLVTRPGGGAEAALTAFAGEVRAREESPLSFRVGGNLVRREVDVGDRVKRGDLLAVLDPGDFRLEAQSAQAQVASAQAELERARAEQARYAALAKDQLVSRSALDTQTTALRAAEEQARAARAQLDVARNQAGYTELRAPRDGAIATRLAEAGQVVAAGQTVFTIAADSGREVAIALPESRIRDFVVGRPVLVELWSTPGRRLPGRIREIAPVADSQARTYAARVTLVGDAAKAVELGQSARVYVQENGNRAALSVPLSAIQRDANGATALWVVDPKTRKLTSHAVKLGPYAEDRVPVLSGVSPDAWIVVAGGHLLRENQLVEPVDRQNKPVLPALPARAVARNE
jgi:multidrug efflux system membrane fusion protein